MGLAAWRLPERFAIGVCSHAVMQSWPLAARLSVPLQGLASPLLKPARQKSGPCFAQGRCSSSWPFWECCVLCAQSPGQWSCTMQDWHSVTLCEYLWLKHCSRFGLRKWAKLHPATWPQPKQASAAQEWRPRHLRRRSLQALQIVPAPQCQSCPVPIYTGNLK